jgi:TonB family protein
MPDYPQHLRDKKLEADVELFFFVEPDGKTNDVTFGGSPPEELAKLSKQAVLQWRFEPLVRGGRPIRQRLRQVFSFKVS